MSMQDIRITSDGKLLGIIRIILGIVFLMTGVMKFFFPVFTEAWLGQLIQAGIPLVTFNFFLVPIIEILLGLILLKGFFTRFFTLIVFPIMLVAIYAHFAVEDASLFPIQPKFPIVPIIVIIMATILLRKGAGSWSDDLRWTIKSKKT
jgi:putative oxidoreductase